MAVLKSVSVVVVEGELSALNELGFPLPALATMQDTGVLLRDASWDIRKSTSGLSVSFFWPFTNGNSRPLKTKPKRKRNKRQRRRKHHVDVKRSVLPPEENTSQPSVSVIPSDAHLPVHNPSCPAPCSGHVELSSDREVVDNTQSLGASSVDTPASSACRSTSLVATTLSRADCVVVEPEMKLAKKISLSDANVDDPLSEVFYYELDDNSPGVCVESGDGISWSPVKISRTCVKAASDCDSTCSGETSDVELKPPEIGSIMYENRYSVPGFEVETHDDDDDNVFWIPIAHRTRSRFKT